MRERLVLEATARVLETLGTSSDDRPAVVDLSGRPDP